MERLFVSCFPRLSVWVIHFGCWHTKLPRLTQVSASIILYVRQNVLHPQTHATGQLPPRSSCKTVAWNPCPSLSWWKERPYPFLLTTFYTSFSYYIIAQWASQSCLEDHPPPLLLSDNFQVALALFQSSVDRYYHLMVMVGTPIPLFPPISITWMPSPVPKWHHLSGSHSITGWWHEGRWNGVAPSFSASPQHSSLACSLHQPWSHRERLSGK